MYEAVYTLAVLHMHDMQVCFKLVCYPTLTDYTALHRIHTMGSSSRIKDHPEGRAIFYEEKIYSRRKITDFIVALEGFKASLNIAKVFSAYTDCLDSRLLKSLVLLAPSRGGERTGGFILDGPLKAPSTLCRILRQNWAPVKCIVVAAIHA